MGEAKRREAVLRAALLKECDLWDTEASEWEANAVAEIQQLPVHTAVRIDAEQLKQMGMQPRECHTNAAWYANNDPSGAAKRVLGWWAQGDLLVLHSVVAAGGRLVCITPQESDVPTRFPFIPDEKITAAEDGEVIRFYRDGVAISAGLRMDPAAHRTSIRVMRERLEAGMKPRQVMVMADREAMERLGLNRP